jgi:hypothetical protein
MTEEPSSVIHKKDLVSACVLQLPGNRVSFMSWMELIHGSSYDQRTDEFQTV